MSAADASSDRQIGLQTRDAAGPPVSQGAPLGTPTSAQATFFRGPSLANLDPIAPPKILAAPQPLRLLAFLDCQGEKRPFGLPPPSASTAGRLTVRATLAGQFGPVLSAGAQHFSASTAGFALSSAEAIAHSRCILACLLSTRRYGDALTESTACLGSLLDTVTASAGQRQHAALVAALATFILLHAEVLRLNGCWRESVFVSHGLQRVALAAAAGRAGELAVAHTTEGTANGAGATWASAEPFSTDASAPVVERCLAHLQRYRTALAGPQTLRILYSSAVLTSAALQDAGYNVAAGNAMTEAVTVLTSIARAEEAKGPDSLAVDLAVPGLPATSSLAQRLACAPAWLWAGLAIQSHISLLRGLGKEADATAAQATLDSLPVWSRVSGLFSPKGDVSPSMWAEHLATLPLGLQYCAAGVGAQRAAQLAQAGRITDALAVAEVTVVLAAAVVKHTVVPWILGEGSGLATGGATETAAEDAALLGLDAAAASCCVLSWCPDPCESLVQGLVLISDCVRKIPPVGQGNPSMTAAVAAGVLEASIRACPPIALRTELISALTGMYESGRDPGASAVAKRALQAVAGRFGLLGHLDPIAFRLGSSMA